MPVDTYEIIKNAKRELDATNIEFIVSKFGDIVDEFEALVDATTQPPNQYRSMLDRFITKLCERFSVRKRFVHIRARNYGTDVWGPLFWKFLHFSSILVTYMYSKNEINDMLDFPILVYNINYILPCSVCTAHYMSIKSSNATRAILKELAFGNLIGGVHAFHNLITSNINSHLQNPNDLQLFSTLDFAKIYKCLDRPENESTKSITYIKNYVDWQPDLHRILSILYATMKNTSYRQSSDELKRLYEKPKSELCALAKDLERAIVLNIDKTTLEANFPVIESTIVELHRLYPAYVDGMVEAIDGNDSVIVGDNNNQTNKELLVRILNK